MEPCNNRGEALNSGWTGQGGEVLPKGEAIEEISISFPGRLEGLCLPGRDKVNKTEARMNWMLDVVMELQAVEQGDKR